MITYKKYIDSKTVKDVPQNGVILMATKTGDGEFVEERVGVSNLPLKFEQDEQLANKNGYYKCAEDYKPEYDEKTAYLDYEYLPPKDGVIKKVWTIKERVEKNA